jgi:hypothetical protein
MILLFAGIALAGGVHAGIPVRGVPGLGEPTFLTPASGWTTEVSGGWVRVFVGATEVAGAEWYARQLESIGRPPSPYTLAGADEAHGDGASLVMFRDGNVGVVVRGDTNAAALATTLKGAIVAAGPRVVATMDVGPDLGEPYGRWKVSAPGAAAIRAANGAGVDGGEAAFKVAPTAVYVWDAYGRVTVLTP